MIPEGRGAMLGDREEEVYPHHTQNGCVLKPIPQAHNWEEEKRHNENFSDDGTMSFFWSVCSHCSHSLCSLEKNI